MQHRRLSLFTNIASWIVLSWLFQQPCLGQSERLTRSVSSTAGTQQPANEATFKCNQLDATLRSIASLSADQLVAVGDRGTILLTADAGLSWKQVVVPTSANLYDVQFDGEIGYAVGGWIGTESGSSYGVLLRSTDGGTSWQVNTLDHMPRLLGIRQSVGRLICWGDYSNQHGTSVFASSDQGAIWTSAADNLTHAAVAAVSTDGWIGAVDRLGHAQIQPDSVQQLLASPRSPLQALLCAEQQWLAAGQRGDLIASPDGRQWFNVPLPLDAKARQMCQWNCLAAHGSHRWVAGSPGSLILHSMDQGKTWDVQPTGQGLPIHGLLFLDGNRGWAVGALGTIMATRDGGANWYPQRQQAKQVALLSIASNAESMPWLATVAATWDFRLATANLALSHDDPVLYANHLPSPEEIGGCAAAQIGSANLSVCDTSGDDPALASQRIAVQIATWRPHIVLCADNSAINSSKSQSVSEQVMQALSHMDDSSFQSLAKALFLDRWDVTKVVSSSTDDQGQYAENSHRLLSAYGLSISDVLACLPRPARASQRDLYMTTTWCRNQSRAARADLLGGVALTPDSQLTSSAKMVGSFRSVMGRTQRDQAWQQLQHETSSIDQQQWLNKVRFLLQSEPESQYADVFNRLIDGLYANQQWHKGLWVLEQTAPFANDLGLWASRRHLQVISSRELRHWMDSTAAPHDLTASGPVQSANYRESLQGSPFGVSSVTSVVQTASVASDLNASILSGSGNTSVQLAGGTSLKQPNDLTTDRTDWTAAFSQAIRIHPRLGSQPDIQMLLAKMLREQDKVGQQRQILTSLVEQSPMIAWTLAAKQELAILDEQEESLKWKVQAQSTSSPPQLDGQLNEPFWESAQPMQLAPLNGISENASTLRWAYDSQFVYLGVTCLRDAGNLSMVPAKSRSYDADLTGLDRIELMIDVDRDYSTVIELSIAENGLTQDRCLGMAAFNPRWFVTVLPSSEQWQAEIAIRIDQFTDQMPESGSKWAVTARRIGRQREPASWSQLKTHQLLPEAAGLLIFQ